MNQLIDLIMILLILSNLTLLGLSRLSTCIFVVAMQGLLLGLLPLTECNGGLVLRLVFLSGAIIVLKGIVFPSLLMRTLRDLDIQHEVEPFIGYSISFLMAPLIFIACIWIGKKLVLPVEVASSLVVPVAFFTISSGLFLIISRKKALTQVLGYLVLENGIYVFGMSIASKQPVLVELGILLDVFMAVFVMGIAIFHINREFEHTDVDRLDRLKG
jgi:hydrogenase-4 component E